MNWKPVYEGKQPAAWVKELAGKSGVYLIASAGVFRTVLYIGESHTGRLKKTLLRHFQHWKGKTAGPSFDPSKVVVAVVRTPPGASLRLQDDLIAEYDPPRNKEGRIDL